VGRSDVEHEEPVDVANESLVVEAAGEELSVLGRLAPVTAHVQIPAVLRRDDADVLTARLRALTGTARHPHLEFVRGTQAAIAQFESDGHPHRILDAVAAPGGADATLDGPQRLAVCLPRFHAGVDEPFPDLRELLDAGTEQV